jgi:caa(3)-type oxidase subunit IV
MSEEHGHSINYVKVWATLLILLVISVLGPMVGVKAITLITAFGIAAVKAYLVAKNFMHINLAKRYVTYIVVTCLAFMFLLFVGVAPDVMADAGQRWEKIGAWIEQSHVEDGAGAHGGGGSGH